MKRINLEELNRRNDYMIDNFMRGVLSMEFIKVGDKYLLKGSNSVILSEEEKLKYEKNELVLNNNDCDCEVEKIKKVSKINKKIKEIEKGLYQVPFPSMNPTHALSLQQPLKMEDWILIQKTIRIYSVMQIYWKVMFLMQKH